MQWRNVHEGEYADIAATLLRDVLVPNDTHATVLALFGTLGAGKTTFARALARALRITQHIKSPTFIIESRYTLFEQPFTHFVHIDAYRLVSESNLQPLQFERTFAHPRTLVVIEWPEHLQHILPAHATRLRFDIVSEGRTLTVVE